MVKTDIDLKGNGFWQYSGPSCPDSDYLVVQADLHKFTARLPYSQTFSSTPEAWVRWGNSDGYEASGRFYDPYIKGLRAVNTDRTELTVEGHYWKADFYTSDGQKCASDQPIPKTPGKFNVAYTAVGTEGPPPVEVTISGPSSLNSGESGTWTANTSGGAGSLSYQWYEKYEADNSFAAVSGATSDSYSSSYQGNVTLKVKVTADNSSDTDTHAVTVDCDQFCTQSIDGTQSLRAQTSAVPDTFALHASRPNPVRSTSILQMDLPEDSRVQVTVYDVMGRRVAQLVNRRLAPGRHPVHIEAATWPSGVYFVRMQAGSYAKTRRVNVVR